MGLAVTGTLGVLDRAAERGLIDLRFAVAALRQTLPATSEDEKGAGGKAEAGQASLRLRDADSYGLPLFSLMLSVHTALGRHRTLLPTGRRRPATSPHTTAERSRTLADGSHEPAIDSDLRVYGATLRPTADASDLWRASKDTNSSTRINFAVATWTMSKLRVP